ncbi:MAG: homocysteine S-methyltransferase family protein [Alistipes sp.]|nr:homocysteine S-methyltransferase family protein [Alistipes sp.]
MSEKINNGVESISELLQRRIVVGDAAVGTALVGTRRDLCPDTLSITEPEKVVALHEAAINAGAKLITSNTFLADPLMLKECGVEYSTEQIVEAAIKAIRAAQERSGRNIFIAGSIGPSVRNITLAIDLDEATLRESYRTLIAALAREGVDIFLIESITDVRNAEIAAELCREIAPDTPIIFSAVLSKIGGLLISGRSIEKYVADVEKFEPLAIGFNCSTGVKSVVDNIELLTRYTKRYTYCSPSAGIPDNKGRYAESVKRHTETLRTAAERGLLNIVGGCCGTTAEYTRSVAQMARHYKPRKTE